MFHPVFATTHPSVLICCSVETGILVHARIDQVISEFSVYTLTLFLRYHCGFLTDLLCSCLVHGLGKTFSKLLLFLSLLLWWYYRVHLLILYYYEWNKCYVIIYRPDLKIVTFYFVYNIPVILYKFKFDYKNK